MAALPCAARDPSPRERVARALVARPVRAAGPRVAGGRAEEARKCLRGLGYTGSITNGGGPDDLAAVMPDALAAAAEQSAARAGAAEDDAAEDDTTTRQKFVHAGTRCHSSFGIPESEALPDDGDQQLRSSAEELTSVAPAAREAIAALRRVGSLYASASLPTLHHLPASHVMLWLGAVITSRLSYWCVPAAQGSCALEPLMQ